MMRAVRIAGEGFDADWVETPVEHEDPSYPMCSGCDEETINDAGWCANCEAYAAETAAFQRAADERWLKTRKIGPDRWEVAA